MFSITTSKQFEKDLKRCKKRGYDMAKLEAVLIRLREDGRLPAEFRQHKLVGNYAGLWECHIKSDWLLVWEENGDELILTMLHTGTHNDLFN